jgi:hypothetical protein
MRKVSRLALALVPIVAAAVTTAPTAFGSSPSHNPVGHVDAVTRSGRTVTLTGWAYDPDRSAASTNVTVYVNGRSSRQVLANRPRADVNRARHVSGRHGWSTTLTLTSGATSRVSVYALNFGPGDPRTSLATVNIKVPVACPTGTAPRATPASVSITRNSWLSSSFSTYYDVKVTGRLTNPTSAPVSHVWVSGTVELGGPSFDMLSGIGVLEQC